MKNIVQRNFKLFLTSLAKREKRAASDIDKDWDRNKKASESTSKKCSSDGIDKGGGYMSAITLSSQFATVVGEEQMKL